MIYSFKSRVRYSEVGEDRRLTLNSVINYFQDCSTFHSEDIGAGMEYLENKKRAWLLSSWQIGINRYPFLGEQINSKTWAYDFKKYFGSRNYVLEDEKGDMLAYANSLWVFVDVETGRPTAIPEEDANKYGLEERLTMDYASRKIKIPHGSTKQPSFPVRKYHLDTNHHVNNGQYIQMAKEWVPRDFEITQLRAEYKKQAKLGDVVVPSVYAENGTYTIALCDENEEPYVITEFRGVRN